MADQIDKDEFMRITGVTDIQLCNNELIDGIGKNETFMVFILEGGAYEWYRNGRLTELQGVLDPKLSDEAKLEIVLKYG